MTSKKYYYKLPVWSTNSIDAD